MGLLKNVLLITGGAAAGFLATRTRVAKPARTDLEVRTKTTLERFTSEGGTMARFFDSTYGAPFKNAALKALGFAATVKAGMDEKEAELKNRFDAQTQDVRPGSLDTWQQLPPDNSPTGVMDSDALPSAVSREGREAEVRKRLARDAELGKDFFA
ncbi:hypothetical protein [Rothia nasisuis]|uniref:hypothetical protein n=1 Tax=Rothia nasisuis TaxID=2109647 RepID=UPI001F15EA52|nr:hypothetical protein [Rothia nasisuis]